MSVESDYFGDLENDNSPVHNVRAEDSDFLLNENVHQNECQLKGEPLKTDKHMAHHNIPRFMHPWDEESTETSETKNKSLEVDPEARKANDKIPVEMEATRWSRERLAVLERLSLPLELRVQCFRELLVEKQVSAFSTWEKELHKIVFDDRYLVVNSKERRETFESYVKERAEDERREKESKLKQKLVELLEEANLNPKDEESTETSETKNKSMEVDPEAREANDKIPVGMEAAREAEERAARYALFNSEERRQKFERCIKEREKESKLKKEFMELLGEANLNPKSSFPEFSSKFSKDERFKAIENSRERESLFQDYLADLTKCEKDENHRDNDDKQRDKKKVS